MESPHCAPVYALSLIQEAPVPVVPAYRGNLAAWPPQRRWPRLKPVSIAFDAARSPAGLRQQGAGADGPARIVSALVQRVAELRPAAITDGPGQWLP